MGWRATCFFLSVAMLAGCGGGGGGASVPSTVTPIATPATVTATSSETIAAATGGAVSTTLNGQTVTVTIPAGALSRSTNVALTVYTQAGLSRNFASSARKIESVPTNASFIIGMGLSIGSSTLRKPLSFNVANAPNIAVGSVLRLAASQQGAFGDIDTATETTGTITESENPAYAGVSLANASILYAFYDVPSASASAPPNVTLIVAGPTSVVGGSQATYSSYEADANGFPFLSPSVAFSVVSSAVGAISSTTGVFSAATANNLAGQIVGTDRRNPAISGSLPITVLSSRPATTGDAISYAGTFSSSIANNAISTSPVVTTQSGTVAQTTSVTSNSPGQAVLVANESDNLQLSSLTTKTTATIAYQPAGASTGVRLLTSSASDSNGATYATLYTATSGLLTLEPETPGAFGPNDASQTYSETDPGFTVGATGQNVTTIRTTASNGAYSENTTNADGSTNAAVQNADGSGLYTIGPKWQFAIGSPASGASPSIPITPALEQDNVYVPEQTQLVSVWYPLPLALYTESDTIGSTQGYDSRCNVPAKYGTPSSLVMENITSIDAVYGNLENQTTTAYDVTGVGTVCSIFTDSTQTFYDYTGQEGPYLIDVDSTTPVLLSNVTEVLSITGGTVSGQPVSTQSRERSATTISHLAITLGRERFRHAVHEAKIAQAVRIAQSLQLRMKGAR